MYTQSTRLVGLSVSHTRKHTHTYTNTHKRRDVTHCNTQCVAVCCTMLQCVAESTITKHTAACHVLQCVAVCCGVVQTAP